MRGLVPMLCGIAFLHAAIYAIARKLRLVPAMPTIRRGTASHA